MSRIGKLPVPLPAGVTCDINGLHIKVSGPKGVLERDLCPEVSVGIVDGEVHVTRSSDLPAHRAKHGLTRALIANMVTGVTTGYTRTLLIEGVGYRAALQGANITLALGYSHPVVVEPPDGITFTVEGTQTMRVTGINKELVGQVAADIRAWRKPEPYKGKGIRYDNEKVRRKVGKAGSK